MAVFEFTLTGKLEVDADALGVAVANNVRRKHEDDEIDVDAGFHLRMNPASALELLLPMAVSSAMNATIQDGTWTPHFMEASVEQVEN